MCTCEESDKEKVGLFNLRDVTSEVELNYVVVGMRITEVNHVVHIQIQQGKLMEYGTVSMSSIAWKPVEDFSYSDKTVKSGRDYHPISWYKRTFCMDQLQSPPNHVITGFRFKLINNYMRFEIRVNKFNFARGKLFVDEYQWISNKQGVSERPMIDLQAPDPIKLNETLTNQCFKFNTSRFEEDAGQTTIPDLELSSIEPVPATPLGGARIILKNPEQSQSLSFSLLTYDIGPHFTDSIENS
ncbi:hypothetical protein QAD02_023187 [Eretmocerus hayati]|uniref:Uncharacterized protein n=1 Tax=Eretmocerus hayati TaxID=131215 RepID=A0ACC2PW88_9HYME|nr:hypothetical protein QAD02_023187 [Eretmocerus hayati]